MSVTVNVAVTPAGGVPACPVGQGAAMPNVTMQVYSLNGGAWTTVGSESVLNPLNVAIPAGLTVPVYGPDADGFYYIQSSPNTGLQAPGHY